MSRAERRQARRLARAVAERAAAATYWRVLAAITRRVDAGLAPADALQGVAADAGLPLDLQAPAQF